MKLTLKLAYSSLIAVCLWVGFEFGVLQAAACFILLFASCAFTIDIE